MKIQLLDTKTNQLVEAEISPAIFSEMPLKKDGWQFNWRELFRTEGAMFYKIMLKHSFEVQGMIMLKMANEEMLELKNIEIAPHNLGSNGEYDRCAGCLLAFSYLQCKVLGKNNYQGFLALESKTRLIELYQNKYGATYAMGNRMFFDKPAGEKLIEKYLNYGND